MKKVNQFICRGYFLLAIVLISVQVSIAQTHQTITGSVQDVNGESLIGVNVVEKGTTYGTITDINGRFNLSVSTQNPTLQISYLGYENQEIEIVNGQENKIILKESFMNLDEVFVVGYGVQKKSHLTGAVSKVKSESMAELPVSSIDQALQGKLAGVTIQNTTSEVGEAPQIRIRGMGSISASSEPLVVVDGYPTSDGLSMVDLGDVESVEVLKDAASGAIYGSRAANGVILITTKSGNINKPKYAIKAFGGLKYAYQLHPIMTTDEYLTMRRNEEALGGETVGSMERSWGTFENETDWQREGLNEPASIYNAQFSVSGGKKELRYYISSSYLKDEGIMIDNDYEKFSVRAKMDATLSPKIKMGINLTPTYSKRQRPATNYIDFYRSYGWLPVKHNAQTSAITGKAIGEYAHGRDFNNQTFTDENGEFTARPWSTSNNNPRSIMDNEKRFRYDYRLQTNAYLSVKITDDLEFKTSNGFYFKYNEVEEYRNLAAKKDGEPNRGVYGNELFLDLLTENTFDYNKSFGLHGITALAGFTAQKTKIKSANMVGLNFPTDYVPTLNAASTIELTESQTFREEIGLMSVLGRLTYSYDDKYLMSASLRTDGSSLFGPENRWGWFPAVSLGWRVSEEGFMEQFSWVDQLKLRASYGVTGNNDIPNYAHQNKLNPANYPFGANNGSVQPGLANVSSTLANKGITWEQTDEYNFGMDLNVLNSRINISAEYYYSVTRKLLFKQPALSFTGYTEYWNNIGKVRNRGLEFELTTYNIKNKQFEWTTSFNIAANQNRILEIGGEERFINKGERSEQYLAQVGNPAIQYFGYKTIGVWNSQEEINNNASHISDKPGGLRVADLYKDGVINDKDRTALGNPFPDYTWGFSNRLSYKAFDLSVMIQGVQGLDIFNGDGYYVESKRINLNYVSNRWINAENPGDGKTPYENNGILWQETDYMIEDGSYVALRDVVLGYTLPKRAATKMGLSGLRLYLSGQNLFYIWSDDYRGVNPEARYTYGAYTSPLIDGYQRGGFPIQSTVTGGIEISF